MTTPKSAPAALSLLAQSFLAFSLLALGAAAPAAASQLVQVSGSGVWADNAPVTAYSVPGETYAFKFRVDAAYPASFQDVHVKETTSFQGYQFELGGSAVAGAPDDIAFFDSALDGGLALAYADHSIEFIGPDIGSSGTLAPGHYSVIYPNMDYALDGGVPINEGAGPAEIDISPVPEPGAWALVLLGFAAAGGTLRARRRFASRCGKNLEA